MEYKKIKFYTILLALNLFLPNIAAANTTLLVLGDSISAGYGVEHKEAYPHLVLATLQEKIDKNITLANASESGATTSAGVRKIKWLIKKKPSHMLIALGANDGLRGIPVQETEKNIEEMILLGKKNHIRVYLAGMKIPMNYGPRNRKEFEEIYTNLAKKHQIPLLPFLLEGVAANEKLNQPDKIHPNAEGQKIIAQNVAAFLIKNWNM